MLGYAKLHYITPRHVCTLGMTCYSYGAPRASGRLASARWREGEERREAIKGGEERREAIRLSLPEGPPPVAGAPAGPARDPRSRPRRSPTQLSKGAGSRNLAGLQTGSGQTGFSQKGHKSLTCCNSLV